MGGDHGAVLHDLDLARAATNLDPLPSEAERHAVLTPFEGHEPVDPNHPQRHDIEGLRQGLGQARQVQDLAGPGLGDARACCRTDALTGQGFQPPIGPLLQLGQITPGMPARIKGEALIADAALDLAFGLRLPGRAGIDMKVQNRCVAPVVGLSVPHAPAPRAMAVFSLSTRTVAGTPPSRLKQAVWHPSQASMSLVSDQTIAVLRLHDRTMCRATRSWATPPTTMPGK